MKDVFFFFSLLYHTPLISKRYKGYDNRTKDKDKGNDNMMVSNACLGALKVFLENVIHDDVTYTEHAKRKIVSPYLVLILNDSNRPPCPS
jgi:hypothetical protein